jgi:hypothetical protein
MNTSPRSTSSSPRKTGPDRRSGLSLSIEAFAAVWIARLHVVALAVWTGGFTFYSGVVIPILHDRLGDAFEVGQITRTVTDALNAIGLSAILLGWLAIGLERQGERSGWVVSRRRLFATTVLLVALIGLHRRMDRMLDAGTLVHFYTWHRVYLLVSIAQWLVNLSLLIPAGRSPAPGEAESVGR